MNDTLSLGAHVLDLIRFFYISFKQAALVFLCYQSFQGYSTDESEQILS